MPRKQQLHERHFLPEDPIKQEAKRAKQMIPWGAENLDEFLFYCCPECDDKFKESQNFLDHAMHSHDNSNQDMETMPMENSFAMTTTPFVVSSETPLRVPGLIPETVKQEEFVSNDDSVDPLSCEMDEVKQELQPEETVSGEVTCNLCNKKFKNKNLLGKHFKLAHPNKVETFACEHCGGEYMSKHVLQKHIKKVHMNNSTKCDMCDFVGKNLPEINSHKHTHRFKKLSDGSFQCYECHKIFTEAKQISQHIHLKCDLCCYSCVSKQNFDVHMVVKHGSLFDCEQCEEKFSDRRSWKIHVKEAHPTDLKAEEVPTEGNKISCAICESKFPSIYDLSIHNQDEHQEDKDLVICPICNFSTKLKRYLKKHIKAKHETSKVSCPECNRLIKENTLDAHMASSHSGESEKKHKCTYEDCEFQSNNVTSLHYHTKSKHPSDSTQHQFACDKCGKTFPFASGLKQHVDIVHLKLKKYICEQCGKGFNSRIEFNKHQALPSCNFMSGTDVIFNCDKCRDTFDTLRGYIRHHQVMHGDFPANLPNDSTLPTFMCDECPKVYLKQQTLELHKKHVHRGILPKPNNK